MPEIATGETPFSPSYTVARDRFRTQAALRGGRLHTLRIDAPGPQGEPLSIDIAVFGAQHPRRVLLHSSGLHGVEGFAGSAIQLRLLENLPDLPPDGALVLVHVLNPYGMAWLRRTNESNVDLNRNFLGPDEAYEGAPEAYKTLHPLLNKEKPPSFDFFLIRTVGQILRRGYNTLKQAVVGGQYAFPLGLFFGGAGLEQGPHSYGKWLGENLTHAQRIVAIDVHTGLGKTGEDTLLVEASKSDPLYLRLEKRFGARVAPWDADESVAYAIRGGLPGLLPRLFPHATVDFVTQEFGTRGPLRVLHALREENRWHHFGDGHLDHPVKGRLLDAFRPDDADWYASVLSRGEALFEQACALAFDAAMEEPLAATSLP